MSPPLTHDASYVTDVRPAQAPSYNSPVLQYWNYVESLRQSFQLPFWFDVAAFFLFGVTGALKATERGYDYTGVLTLSILTGAGGGILRDVLLATRPVALTNGWYLTATVLAAVVGVVFGHVIRRVWSLFELFDALGLAIFSVVGTLKGIHAGLELAPAVLLGTLNAAGGGMLRDIIVREEPMILRPGQHYYGVAIFGSVLLGVLVLYARLPSLAAGLITITLTFLLRVLVIRYNMQTRPVRIPTLPFLPVGAEESVSPPSNGGDYRSKKERKHGEEERDGHTKDSER